MADRVPRWSLMMLFGAASLIAVLAGCWTAQAAGVPMGVWGRMIGAWGLGLVLALVLARGVLKGAPRAGAVVIATIALLMLVWTDTGLQGVHRWIVIGTVRLNVAAVVLPLAIVVLAEVVWAPVAMLAITVLLAAQPDASQATGFAVAAMVLLRARGTRPFVLGMAIAIALVAAASWLRPDLLASVAEVEGIVGLAWEQAPAVAIVAVVALVIAALAPIAGARWREGNAVAGALAAYMVITAAMPAIGAFPVPLVGISMSPIIGFWLGIGALAARRVRDQ